MLFSTPLSTPASPLESKRRAEPCRVFEAKALKGYGFAQLRKPAMICEACSYKFLVKAIRRLGPHLVEGVRPGFWNPGT